VVHVVAATEREALDDGARLASLLGSHGTLDADAVGDTFAPTDRPVRAIADPDPCGRYGPRNQPGGFVTRLVTGLYVPEVNTGTREDAPAESPRP
jgi:hypothetical protein